MWCSCDEPFYAFEKADGEHVNNQREPHGVNGGAVGLFDGPAC